MSLTPEMMTAMLSAGLSAEQIVAVVNANLAAEKEAAEAKAEKRRADTAERVRKHREARRNASNALQDVTGVTSVTADAAPNGPSPCPPQTPPITPTPNTHSEPNGSAAVAAIDLDPRQQLFGRGKAVVRTITGRSMEQCGSLIGQWLKLANDSAVIVLAAIDEGATQELANPVPWIGQRIKREMSDEQRASSSFGNGSAGGRYGQSSFDERAAGVVSALDRFRQRPGQQPDRDGPANGAAGPSRFDPASVVDAEWTAARGHR